MTQLMVAPLRDDPQVELHAVVVAALVGQVELGVVRPLHLVDVVPEADGAAWLLVEQV
jgi:hypothetical protein